tara:strand:+ start:2363 stop:2545 length:183 start_codon:yes stop_codon:yes gene_type:complete
MSNHIHIIVSDSMARQMEEDARSYGMTKSAFIRHLFLVWRQFISEKEGLEVIENEDHDGK